MLTKEQIEELRDDAAGCGEHATCHKRCVIIRELCDEILALRAVGGEAVAWRHWHGKENDGWEYYESAHCPDCQPLYTAPAAPANEALAGRLREIMSTVQNFEGWQGEVFKEINAVLGGGE